MKNNIKLVYLSILSLYFNMTISYYNGKSEHKEIDLKTGQLIYIYIHACENN